MPAAIARDYALTEDVAGTPALTDSGFRIGEEGRWWTPGLDRKTLKELTRREDARPIANYGLWLILLAASGYVAFLTWGSWWAVPAFLVYGTIYSSCDPRSHDLGHGTTFRTRWLNSAFLHLTLFMTMKEPVMWRWRHARHHTDTIHVGRDPEIQVSRPADLLRIAADFFFVFLALTEVKPTVQHAFGTITGDARHYVPRSEWRKLIWSARLLVAAYVAVAIWCIAIGSIFPVIFLWGPRFYANWLNFFGYLTQHAGLAEDAFDHRLNTRTVVMNPVFEFLYANLNYHIEHHIYPLVPYFNLPTLHRILEERGELPYTYRGLADAHREVMPALWRQSRETAYFVRRKLPAPA